jgi:glycosyl transferase family 1/glycosyl transferase family 4
VKILWVATKPPWPPVDGGRLLLGLTLEALASRGVSVDLVAPFDLASEQRGAIEAALRGVCRPRLVPAPRRSRAAALARALLGGRPVSVARHARPEVRAAVARQLETEHYDLVAAEQLQALAACEPAVGRVPVVLRCQNVESDLWLGLSRLCRPSLRPLLRLEARRLARWEATAVRNASATLALSGRDAARLAELAGDAARIHCVPAPFPARLEPAAAPLAGSPAVVLLGDPRWLPNRDAARWFTRTVWPAVRRRLPGAVLHRLYGRDLDSRAAFPGLGAVLAVPTRIASGVRMKILEAWARGTPAVATPEAVAGLEVRPGREILVGRDAEELAAAIGELHSSPGRAEALVEAGRALLRERHDPATIATRLLDVYGSLMAGGSAS